MLKYAVLAVKKFDSTWLERSQARKKMKDGGNGPGFVVDVNVGQF